MIDVANERKLESSGLRLPMLRMTAKRIGRLWESRAFASLADYRNDRPCAVWTVARGNPNPAHPYVRWNCNTFRAVWPNDPEWNTPDTRLHPGNEPFPGPGQRI